MTSCPARVGDPAFGRGAGWNVTLWLVGGVKGSLHLVMAQGRTTGHQLCFYQGTSKLGTGFRDRNVGKTSYLGAAVCCRTFIEVCLVLFLCDLRVSFPMRHNFQFCYIYIYIYICIYIYIYIYIYFGRVFLMLKYTDITQNTYVQS